AGRGALAAGTGLRRPRARDPLRGRAGGRRRAARGGPGRMKAFAELYASLDETTKTNEKLEALVRYFSSAPPADAAWAVYFLSGRKPRQVVPTRRLCEWAAELAQVPEWLFNECYDAVGD